MGKCLPDRRLGRLSPADSGGATLHRQGSDLPDRAGQQQHPPLSRPFSSPLQGHLARPSHGRLVPQAPAPSNPAGKLPSPSRLISIYLYVNVSATSTRCIAIGSEVNSSLNACRPALSSPMGFPFIEPEVSSSRRQGHRGSGFATRSG